MRTHTLVAIAVFSILGVSGCGNKDDAQVKTEKQKPGRVAVVDLNEVARRLGRDQYMVSALKQTQQSLNESLKVVQASYVEQIKEKQEELGVGQEGVKIEDDEAKKLLGMQQQANLNVNQARKQAISRLSQQRTRLISDFRNEVRPIADKVAKEKGLTIVLTKSDTILFSHDDSVDITDEVAKRLKAISPPAAVTAQQPQALQPQQQDTQQK